MDCHMYNKKSQKIFHLIPKIDSLNNIQKNLKIVKKKDY